MRERDRERERERDNRDYLLLGALISHKGEMNYRNCLEDDW